MAEFFTADTHFGHAEIIEYSKRPFDNVFHMDEVLIANWNKTVRPQDTVWHLGDFNFGSEKIGRDTEWYLDRLNGHIHLVFGNHDDKGARAVKGRFASAQDYKYLRLHDEKITLSHYAHRVWRNSHRGAWHLYGHSHGALPNYHRSMDVGVDPNNYTPVSFATIKKYMDQQVVTLHHPELVTDPWNKEEA